MIALLAIGILCHLKITGAYFLREKRSLIGYNQVVKCAIDGNPLFTFDSYGCYCGGGGLGGPPIDEIDRCCMNHDLCYDMLVSRRTCSILSRYLESYDWQCVSNDNSQQDASYAPFLEAVQTVFNSTSGKRTRKFPVCKGSKSECGISLCFCDVQAALCYSKYNIPTEKIKCPRELNKNAH